MEHSTGDDVEIVELGGGLQVHVAGEKTAKPLKKPRKKPRVHVWLLEHLAMLHLVAAAAT